MREAVEVARTDSDTISNVFLSTVKGSVSTFLLESRELTLDGVNCLRSEHIYRAPRSDAFHPSASQGWHMMLVNAQASGASACKSLTGLRLHSQQMMPGHHSLTEQCLLCSINQRQ